MELDRETSKVLTDEKKIEDLTNQDGWKIVEAKWNDAIMDLQSIRNIQGQTPEQVAIDLKARMLAIDILVTWMQDVLGTAEKSKNSELQVKRETYIFRSLE